MSTAAGNPSGTPWEWPWPWPLPDMLVPVLVPVDLALHRGEEGLLDLAGDGAGLAQVAVVDRADGHDLGRRPRQERLVGGVEVGADDVALLVGDAEVGGDRAHAVLGDALEGAGAHRRRDDAVLALDEQVLAGALVHVALGREEDRLVVARLERLDLGHRRVDVHAGGLAGWGHGVDVVALPRRDLHAHAVLQALLAEV